MYRHIVLIAGLLSVLYAPAQYIDDIGNHVELCSGQIIEGQSVQYSRPILKSPVFLVDEQSVLPRDVAFLKNDHGYFARVDGSFIAKEQYAMRIRKGPISMFEVVDIVVYGRKNIELPVQNEQLPQSNYLASGNNFQYYRKGDGTLRKAKYSNLKVDLADSPSSMKHLETHRKYQWLQRGLIALGSGLLSFDIIRQNPEQMKFSPIMAFGIVIGGSSAFCESPKKDNLWWAVESYNH
jgi:hypothetical protein